MKKLVTSLLYLAILAAAFRWTYSVSGWLLFGPGLVLFLDCVGARLLPWKGPAERRSRIAMRLAYVGIGAAALFVVCQGMITLAEALLGGTVLSLAAFLVEVILGVSMRLWQRGQETRSRSWIPFAVLTPAILLGGLFVLPLRAFHPIHILPRSTPADRGLSYEDVKIPTADGLELEGWLVAAPRSRGCVIFCHGHAGNRAHCLGALPIFQKVGLTVLAFDFRGHGASPGHTATFGHREVQDVLAAEAFLTRRFPDQPVFLFGVSYGAAIGLQALPQMSQVRAAWIESCFTRLDQVAANQFPAVPEPCRGWLIDVYSALVWIDCGFWGPSISPIDRLRQVHVPICFCHGREDSYVPFVHGQALYEAYAGPKQCYWVPGAHHEDVGHAGGKEYVKRLEAFFEDRLAACAGENSGRPDGY